MTAVAESVGFVTVFGLMADRYLDELARHFRVDYRRMAAPDLSVRHEAIAVVARGHVTLDAGFLGAFPQLRVVVRPGSGIEDADQDAFRRRNVELVRLGSGPSAQSVAELALALTIGLLRRVTPAHAGLERGKWLKPELQGSELRGRRVGVWGFGPVGRAVADIFAALGCEVRVLSRSGEVAPHAHAATPSDLCDWATVHVVCVPLTAETRGLISEPFIGQMAEREAFLVNMSRWEVLDVDAAEKFLGPGGLGGLAIDPVDRQHAGEATRLLSNPERNVLLTPHLGASTDEAVERMGALIVSSLANHPRLRPR